MGPATLVSTPEAWLWLATSLVTAIAWTNAAWIFRTDRPGQLGDAVGRLMRWRFSPALMQLLRLFFYIGIPSVALLWGHNAVIGSLLGLQNLAWPFSQNEESVSVVAANWADWAHDVGWAVGISVVVWIILALGLRSYRRALTAAGEISPGARFPSSGWVSFREAAFHEVHWAFYRNLPLLALGDYWGVWVGLGIVLIEAVLDPAWRHRLRSTSHAPIALARSALAVSSSVIFLITMNLWMAIASHWMILWCLGMYAETVGVQSQVVNLATD
ncbi:MAG: hypothetical protein GX620_14735 [Chloroflexi bacterium]|nr:hypothetical protein [Chloroflexota bacterium]